MTIHTLRKKLEPTLLKRPGITGVGNVGNTLRIYVEGTDRDFPTKIDGHPVEVFTTGKIKALNQAPAGLSAATYAGLFVGFNMAYRRDALLNAGGYVNVRKGEDWELATRLRRYGKIVFDPEAYVYTDVPFSRQLEFAAIAWNAGMLGIGVATNSQIATGSGTGYFLATLGTAIDQVPDDLHHSQIAVAGLLFTAAFKGVMKEETYRFIMGVFTGILEHHVLTEDIFNPTWARINSSLLLSIILLLAST